VKDEEGRVSGGFFTLVTMNVTEVDAEISVVEKVNLAWMTSDPTLVHAIALGTPSATHPEFD
jgi:hypothetical protein